VVDDRLREDREGAEGAEDAVGATKSIMQKMFWVDLEMTGLDPSTCAIVEVAVVITDLRLVTIEQYHEVVFQPPDVVTRMDPWCVETHGKSGLTAKIPEGRPIHLVERDLIAMAARHFRDEKIVLCGNSVGTDKRFLESAMPDFARLLNYRIVDISSFKEVFASMFGVTFEKKDAHRALDDITESIAELAHYLEYVSAPRPGSS
jgi:oligoribonuclease